MVDHSMNEMWQNEQNEKRECNATACNLHRIHIWMPKMQLVSLALSLTLTHNLYDDALFLIANGKPQ